MKHVYSIYFIVLVLLLAACSQNALPTNTPDNSTFSSLAVTQKQKITRVGTTGLGVSVAISGNWMVVGVPAQHKAYILVRNTLGTWVFFKQLLPTVAAISGFGQSVAISGTTIVIGDYLDSIGNNFNVFQGSAYVYARDQGGLNKWGLIKKISASDAVHNDQFGWSVAVSADTVVVGAYTKNSGLGTDSPGAAYIYQRDQDGLSNWGQVKKLVASDAADGDNFGYTVAINGSNVVVGAPGNGIQGRKQQGSAYIYQRNQGGVNNWGQARQLLANDGAKFDFFGTSLAVSGDTVIVGSGSDDIGTNLDQGSAYIFQRNQGTLNSWGFLKKLVASDGTGNHFYGSTVAMSGTTVITGAPNAGTLGQGSAYVYQRDQGGLNTWGEINQLVASDGVAGDYFGGVVAVSGTALVVGAQADDIGTSIGQGSLYIY